MGNSSLPTCNVRGKETVLQNFLELSRFQNIFSFLSTYKKVSTAKCSGVSSLIVGCRFQCCNFIKRELHFSLFSGYFPKFPLGLLQNTLMKTSVMKFSKILGSRLQFIPHKRQYFKLFGDKTIPIETFAMNSYSGCNLQHF